MFEIMKKSLLAGIGAIAMTEDKIQELIDEVVKKGEISEQEGKSLVKELQNVMEEQREKVTQMIDEQINNVLKELHLVSKNDIADLEQNLRKDFSKVEKRLAKLEKQLKEKESEEK
jgi:polyhydroxyalkanoate synthesis regulator phasin